MNLKLDKFLEDLSEWFGISAAHSLLYNCWVRASAKLLQYLIFSPDKEDLLVIQGLKNKDFKMFVP